MGTPLNFNCQSSCFRLALPESLNASFTTFFSGSFSLNETKTSVPATTTAIVLWLIRPLSNVRQLSFQPDQSEPQLRQRNAEQACEHMVLKVLKLCAAASVTVGT